MMMLVFSFPELHEGGGTPHTPSNSTASSYSELLRTPAAIDSANKTRYYGDCADLSTFVASKIT